MLTEKYVNNECVYYYVSFSQKAIPDPQMQICPAYGTREEFFMRNVINNASDYDYIQ